LLSTYHLVSPTSIHQPPLLSVTAYRFLLVGHIISIFVDLFGFQDYENFLLNFSCEISKFEASPTTEERKVVGLGAK